MLQIRLQNQFRFTRFLGKSTKIVGFDQLLFNEYFITTDSSEFYFKNQRTMLILYAENSKTYDLFN